MEAIARVSSDKGTCSFASMAWCKPPCNLVISNKRPVPTAITLPRVDLVAAEPVKTIPPADFVSTSSRFKITLSCNGRRAIFQILC